jgi:hypothetical protein
VRELHDLGIGDALLDTVGMPAREWALVGRNGNDIYSEPRGLAGRLPLAAIRGAPRPAADAAAATRCASAGPDAVRLGQRVTGYRQTADGVTALVERRDGRRQRGRPAAC